MRGQEQFQEEMFSYGSLSQRVPMDHPLRRVRVLADEAMASLEGRFSEVYSRMGRPSVPPEQMLRALLLQMLYSVRSERMLIEQMEYNLLFRWFVGLGMNEPVWDATSFSKNRERLLSGDVAQAFFRAVVVADKGYHEREFIEAMQAMDIDAHVPRYKCRRPCLLDPAVYDRPEYAVSQKKRKWVERFFAWLKTTANLAKTRHRGHPKLAWNFTLAAAAYNLVRIPSLSPAT